MLSRYHIEITKNALQKFFTTPSLREIAHANVAQDSIFSFFGVETRRHVCDCTVTESMAYVDEEHARIAALAARTTDGKEQRAALGRLLHTVQDFYAHTNYVALWVAEWAEESKLDSQEMLAAHQMTDGMASQLRDHPDLCVAQWCLWRDPIYYVPLLGKLMRRWWLPACSHEAIHLDSPQRGDYFAVAMAIARQRSLAEYARAVAAIRQIGGQAAVARFHGATVLVSQPTFAQA